MSPHSPHAKMRGDVAQYSTVQYSTVIDAQHFDTGDQRSRSEAHKWIITDHNALIYLKNDLFLSLYESSSQ